MLREVVTLAAVLVAVHSAGADYSDQAGWAGVCNVGTSKKQSPVDVISPETKTVVDGKLLELSDEAGALTASNKDASDAIKIGFAETVKYQIPGLDEEGTVAQLHIHWGAVDTEGSEHLLDGKQFAAEAHLVTSYGNDGKYAVINRFFKVGAENGQIKQMITSAKASGAEARKIALFNLTALYPSDIGEVITYEGSLTTPTCDEIVHWVIVPEPLTISKEQLAALRTVKLGDGTGVALTFNWRNKQDLNGREFTCISSSAALLSSYLLVFLATLLA